MECALNINLGINRRKEMEHIPLERTSLPFSPRPPHMTNTGKAFYLTHMILQLWTTAELITELRNIKFNAALVFGGMYWLRRRTLSQSTGDVTQSPPSFQMLHASIISRPVCLARLERSTQMGSTVGVHRIQDYRALLTEGALWVHNSTA